jgi:hypothetical protein
VVVVKVGDTQGLVEMEMGMVARVVEGEELMEKNKQVVRVLVEEACKLEVETVMRVRVRVSVEEARKLEVEMVMRVRVLVEEMSKLEVETVMRVREMEMVTMVEDMLVVSKQDLVVKERVRMEAVSIQGVLVGEKEVMNKLEVIALVEMGRQEVNS